jgi:RHS repeat-associated protein
VFFDTFSSKSGLEPTFVNNYNQGCSIDFPCCSFTGKEKDSETGYGYFGARYMDHELMTMWLSVDPMSDKYPSISPYAYCAWNPVKLVDPDGRELYLIGEDECKEKALAQMNSATKHLQFSINEDGKVVCSGKALSRKERMMERIINSADVTINLFVQDNDFIEGSNFLIDEGGGAFMGNTLDETKKHVTTTQIVNVNSLEKYDNLTNNAGNLIWHGITESFEGGKFSLKSGVPSGNSKESFDRYRQAHNKAGWLFPGTIEKRQCTRDNSYWEDVGGHPFLRHTTTPIPNCFYYTLRRKY